LTEAIRRRPYQVVLLDEIEKAHPDVFNILLQVLDDGRLTDGQGRTVDFRNTVLIMTSNVGSQYISAFTERGDAGDATAYEQMKKQINESLRVQFRPEFLNRIDEVIVFHALNAADLAAIVDLLVADLQRRLAAQDITLDLTPLARALLQGEFKPGAVVIGDADAIGGVLVFRQGDSTIVADAGQRRDARKRVVPEPVGATVSEAVDQVWSPGQPEKSPKRVN
jgi:hypothetical protein